MARHWNLADEADGFSSLGSSLAMMVGVLLLITVPMAAAAVMTRQPVGLRRCLAGTAAFLAVLVPVLVAESLHGQLDLADASLASAPRASMALGSLLG